MTADPTATAGECRPYSILLTDDDAASRDALAGVLADRGFTTRTAACGEEAIEIVRYDTIHLVVFDLHMPRMTGLEALQQVRLFNEALPALLVTAEPTREVIRRAQQAHVYSVLPKPVNASLLVHLLRRALSTAYGER
jgi:DNA-binding NtrC family response regulator